MLQAVIFDMDGVIVDTEGAIAEASIAMFKELYGTRVTREDFSPFVGTGAVGYVQGVAKKYGVTVDIETAIRKREENFARIARAGGIKSFPGAAACIREVKRLGLWAALATSSHRTKMEVSLQGAGIDKNLFDVITSGEECKNLKPDPAIFILTAKRLNVLPQDSLVIEDSPAGIAAAKRGGFIAVGVAHTFSAERLQGADIIVEDIKSLALQDLKKC